MRDCVDEIRGLFSWRHEVELRIGKELGERGWKDLSQTAVIHVRRGDYLQCGSPELGGRDLSLPSHWFSRAARMLTDLPIERAIVVSDDPHWCRMALDLPWPWEISGADVAIDLALLRGARACILSPSSLAWWGAWLNPRPDLRVVAPRYWLGHRVGREYPPLVVARVWLQA